MSEDGAPWVLVGLPGSGKTTLGRSLAEAAGREFVDLDHRVEADAEASVPEIFAREGEAGFRGRELAALESLLAEPAPVVVALGGGTLETPACSRLLSGAAARTIWLDASASDCADRLSGRATGRPLLAETAEVGLEAALRRLSERRRAAYASAELRIDASGPPDRVLSLVAEALGAGLELDG